MILWISIFSGIRLIVSLERITLNSDLNGSNDCSEGKNICQSIELPNIAISRSDISELTLDSCSKQEFLGYDTFFSNKQNGSILNINLETTETLQETRESFQNQEEQSAGYFLDECTLIQKGLKLSWIITLYIIKCQ